MKRIGILIPEFPGQTHNFFWREINALRELGCEVVLFSTRRPPAGVQSTSWGESAMRETTYLHPLSIVAVLRVLVDLLISPARLLRCTRMLFRSIGALQAEESRLRLIVLMMIGVHLGRLCRDRGLSHLHVHSCADAANVALFANAAFAVEYSMTLHNPLSIWGGNQTNKWRHAKFGIVIADWLVRDMQSRIGEFLPPRLFVAPMGVDVEVFSRSAPYRPRRENEALRVISCARLNPAKGFEILLQAIQKLLASGQDVKLTIAGEDDKGGAGYRKSLERFIEENGLGKAVVLLGAVSEDRVRQELEAAHVFVLASYEEPLGVAIMEAMSMEVPVIATNAGGVPSLITDGIDGVLVAPADDCGLAASMHSLGGSPMLCTELGYRGRKRILDAFHHRLSAQTIYDNI